MIPLGSSNNSKNNYVGASVGFTLAAFLLYLAIIYGDKQAETQLVFKDSPFQFHVYCPISSQDHLQQYLHLIKNAQLSDLEAIDVANTYVVYIKARSTDKNNPDAKGGLFYCGLAREWNGDCSNAQIICSAPGPMFYLPVGQSVTIIWINDIDTTGLNWDEDDCYDPDSNDADCSVDARMSTDKDSSGCTFNNPTYLGFPTKKVRVSKTKVPISPHIHGLHTRPIYDGNPLSWFNNVGDRGPAFFSMDNPNYYEQFQTAESFYKMPYSLIDKNLKVMHAPNMQPAGNLFYHDHAMKSTKYNVKNGLGGLYILYDSQKEKDLPTGNYEKFIVFSHMIDGDARNGHRPTPPPPPPGTSPSFPQQNPPSTSELSHQKPSNMDDQMHGDSEDVIFTLNAADNFDRNQLYRIRILNSHFDNYYGGVSFAIYYDQTVDSKGNKVITEIDPSHVQFDLNSKKHVVNFTMIGADSTLFHKSLLDVNQVDLGTAERVQIVIKFDQANGVPRQIKNFYLVCDDKNADETVIKFKFSLTPLYTKPVSPSSSRSSKATTISQSLPGSTNTSPDTFIKLNNSFTDLSLVPPTKIVMKRMRPITSRPLDGKFLLNGHYLFDMGATDYAQIGTIQDWYFINTLWETHPIHTHLVNFQVVQTLSLKMIPQGCTVYELDFYRSTNYDKFTKMTDAELCLYLQNDITMDQATHLYHHLSSFHLQNETKITKDSGKISGFNVLQKINPNNKTQANIYIQPNSACKLNTKYKYLCDQTSNTIPAHYKRWKDTAAVHPFSVSVFRIRWAKTQYDQNIQKYPYFDIPEEHLMQFPGFVYHCHILPHEDNEMMRPYMLTPSDVYLKNATSVLAKTKNPLKSKVALSWQQKLQKINTNLSCRAA